MTGWPDFLERRGWLTPLVLAALTLAFFQRVLLTGGVLVGGDLSNFFYPMFTFVVNEVRGGALPLWNPHLFAGVSVVADPEIAIFYPPNWLLLPLGVARGATLLLVLHVWWGAWGMAKLTRTLGASVLGGLFGGVIYGFSGWLVAQVWAGHYTLLHAVSWLPWALLAYQHALARRTWRAALPGMAALGLTALAGYPPVMIHLGILLLALAALHVLTAEDRQAALALAGRQLAIMLAGGVLLAAVQWLPVAEFARASTRSASESIEFAGSIPLPGAQVLTLLFPNLLGSPVRPESYWGSPFYEELMDFAGLWALVAAALALRLREPAARLLLAVAGLGAVLSLGLDGGLLLVLLRWLPFLRLFRVPGRYLFLVVFALAGLSALVVTRLAASDPDERMDWLRPAWRGWLPIGVTLALVAAGGLRLAAQLAPPEAHVERLRTMAESAALSGLMLAGVGLSLWLWSRRRGAAWGATLALGVVLLDLWRVGLPLLNVAPAPTPSGLWTEIAASVPAHDPTVRVMPIVNEFWEQNEASVSGHYTIYGYESLETERYNNYLDLSDAPVATNNRLLGVRYVVTTQTAEELLLGGWEELAAAAEGAYHVYRVPNPLPRAFVVPEYAVYPSSEDQRDRVMRPSFEPLQTVILNREPDCEPAGGGAATFVAYTPNRVTLDVDADGPGLLVLTDQWYPGWTASVDGQAVEILRADNIFRAVCVPGGAHTVTFSFRPASLRWGGVISLVGWAVLVAAGIAFTLRRVILRPAN